MPDKEGVKGGFSSFEESTQLKRKDAAQGEKDHQEDIGYGRGEIDD